MPETHPSQPQRAVGYALNVFPYNSLAELESCLAGPVLRIKERVFPDEVFPIELRFSERIVRDFQQDPGAIAQLKQFLTEHNLALVTINGFVMPAFHGERVKERVYLPAWHESSARVRFTNECVELLAALAPGTEFVSVSVPFGALKPVTLAAVAPNILHCAQHAATVHRRTGTQCLVALEPEPGLCGETTDEVLEFFDRFVPAELRPYLGVNFDLCHQLVEFEDITASVQRLQTAGVPLAKIHVSNAAELPELKPFYADSIYLHQVCGADATGTRRWFSLDWPSAPPALDLARYRVHYHMPVCPMPELTVGTTLTDVERFLQTATVPAGVPFIIETYTWPEQLRGADRLVDNICRELAWVRQKTVANRAGSF